MVELLRLPDDSVCFGGGSAHEDVDKSTMDPPLSGSASTVASTKAEPFRIGVEVDGFAAEFEAEPVPSSTPSPPPVNYSGCVPGGNHTTEDPYEDEYGYPRWPEEMKDPMYFRREFAKMQTDPRYNKNLGRSMDDPEFWNEAARAPWAKVLLRREQHWTDRRNAWLLQHSAVNQGNAGREQVGELIADCPPSVKRIVAPVMKYRVMETMLGNIRHEAQEIGMPFEELLMRDGTMQEIQSLRRRLDAGGEAEATRLQECVDDMARRAAIAAEEQKEHEARQRGRIVIDMEGLKTALDYGQKCKKDGLIEWERGNVEEALASWHQADKALKQFRAPERCENENEMVAELHTAVLKNISLAAARQEKWTEALDAADRSIELIFNDEKAWFRRACALEAFGRFDEARDALEKIKEIAVGRPDQERLLQDCARRRKRLENLDCRHRSDNRRMLQRGLGKGLFSQNREALLEGQRSLEAEVPTPLTAMDSQNNLGADQLYPGISVEPPPTPACGARMKRDRKYITLEGAYDLLGDLEDAYGEPNFVRRVDKLIRDVRFDPREFLRHLGPVALEVQMPILEKWGFEASSEGLLEMRAALRDFTRGSTADPKARSRAEAVNRALYGSPSLRMYERVNMAT